MFIFSYNVLVGIIWMLMIRQFRLALSLKAKLLRIGIVHQKSPTPKCEALHYLQHSPYLIRSVALIRCTGLLFGHFNLIF